MTGFSIEALKKGIEACDKNIKIFEDAIQKERDMQKEYHYLIEEAERMERKRQAVKKGSIEIKAE